jgi:hypothetical protein
VELSALAEAVRTLAHTSDCGVPTSHEAEDCHHDQDRGPPFSHFGDAVWVDLVCGVVQSLDSPP